MALSGQPACASIVVLRGLPRKLWSNSKPANSKALLTQTPLDIGLRLSVKKAYLKCIRCSVRQEPEAVRTMTDDEVVQEVVRPEIAVRVPGAKVERRW